MDFNAIFYFIFNALLLAIAQYLKASSLPKLIRFGR